MVSTFVIIIPGFASNEQDTTCIPLSQSFIKSLNRNYPAIETIIITIDHPATTKVYEWFGNKVIPLDGTRALARPLLWLKLYRLLKQLSKEKNIYGILNFWCADNALVTHYFSKWNKAPSFTWLQGQDARASNKILRLFTPEPTGLVAISDALKEEFTRNHGIAPEHIIYPGIDQTLFSDNREKDIDIIGVGSLTTLKQYHIFIEVVEALKKDFPAIRAIIVGKGPEQARLQLMIIEKELERNIELIGEQDHDAVLGLMARSKILLHPSSYEGYTIAGLEALAAGCFVVSFVSPERKKVDQWFVAENTPQMTDLCSVILKYPGKRSNAFVPHSIDDTVNQMMALFARRPK